MNKIFRHKYFPYAIAVIVLTVSAVALFWPIISGKLIFSLNSIGHYHYMYFSEMKHFIYDLKMLPNWWPAYDSGYPINLTLDGFLNPIFILTLEFLPPFTANNLMILVFFIINGFAVYLFSKEIKLSTTASLIASISYSFSGVVMRHAGVTGIIGVLPFLPLSFLCCIKIIQGETGRIKWFLFWLALLIYSWIGGWAETIVYSMVAAGFFSAYLIIKNRKSDNFSYRRPIIFFGAIALSVIILSPWFLSVLNFISYSQRSGGVSLAEPTGMATTFSHLIHMFHPRLSVFYGELLPFMPLGSFDYFLYIGTLPFLLVFASIFIKNKMQKGFLYFFLFLATGSVLITINNSPLFWLFHQIPVLKWFGGYWKWSFVIVFSLAILAGYGFDNIKDFFANRFNKKILIIMWIILAGVALTNVTIAAFDQKIKTAISDYGLAHYESTPNRSFNQSRDYYRWNIEKMAGTIVDGFSVKNKWVAITLALWLLALAYFSCGKLQKFQFAYRQKWEILAVFITAMGSVIVWFGFPNGPPVSYLKEESETAKYLHSADKYQSNKLPLEDETAELVPYRIFLYTPDRYMAEISKKYKVAIAEGENSVELAKEMMDYNINIAFNIDTFYSHQTLKVKRLMDIYYLAKRQESFTQKSYEDITPFEDYIKSFSKKENLNLLGALNIKYIISPLELSKLKPVFTAYTQENKIAVYIYENPYFMPRWYFAENIKWVSGNEEKVLEAMKANENFRKTTLLESRNPNDGAIVAKPAPKDTIETHFYGAGALKIKTKTENYRFLVFSESGVPPFWQASINGKKIPIYPANYLYQAVLVPPGENIVEFRYSNLWEQGTASLKSFVDAILK